MKNEDKRREKFRRKIIKKLDIIEAKIDNDIPCGDDLKELYKFSEEKWSIS